MDGNIEEVREAKTHHANVEHPKFEEFLKKQVRYIDKQRQQMDWLIKMWVTIERRNRGVTVSDMAGYFPEDSRISHMWNDLELDPDLPEVHPVNIVRPDIRANTNAMLQADVAIEVEPRREDAAIEQGADIGQKISDYQRTRFWNERERSHLFDMVQKNSACFAYTSYKRSSKEQASIPQFKQQLPMAEMKCDGCGYSHEKEAQPEQLESLGENVEIDCPKCDGKASIGLSGQTAELLAQFDKQSFGDMESELLSPFFIAVDGLESQGGRLDKAGWMEIHRLKSRAELELRYPHFEFKKPDDWCYALKCYYALTYNTWGVLHTPVRESEDLRAHELFEERNIFLHEGKYKYYKAPADYEFVNADGKLKFKIERGQTITEALEKSFGEEQECLRFVWCDNRLTDIIDPREEPTNFRESFTAAHFQPNSSTFWTVPHYDSVHLGDNLTNLNTIMTEFYARNSQTHVAFNSAVFDKDDFAFDLIPSKNEQFDEDYDIRKSVLGIPAPTLDTGIHTLMDKWMQLRPYLSGVTEPMAGIPQEGQSGVAQRIQRDQAMGLLTAPLKSYANMLCEWTYQNLLGVQKYWTLEQFQEVAAEYGEEWTEFDVKLFTEMDLEKDLSIEYRSGTEQPQSILDREIKFQQFMAQVMPFAETGVITPQVMTKIVDQLADFADTDIDVSGTEIDERLATHRFRQLQGVAKQYPLSSQEMEALGEQVIYLDGQTGEAYTAFDALIEEAFDQADITLSEKAENHPVHIAFYQDRIKAEQLRQRKSVMLIELLEVMMETHEQAIPPSPEEQAMMAEQEQAEREAEDQAENVNLDAEAKEKELQSSKDEQAIQKLMDTELELDKRGRDDEHRDADRQVQLQQINQQAQQRAATQ